MDDSILDKKLHELKESYNSMPSNSFDFSTVLTQLQTENKPKKRFHFPFSYVASIFIIITIGSLLIMNIFSGNNDAGEKKEMTKTAQKMEDRKTAPSTNNDAEYTPSANEKANIPFTPKDNIITGTEPGAEKIIIIMHQSISAKKFDEAMRFVDPKLASKNSSYFKSLVNVDIVELTDISNDPIYADLQHLDGAQSSQQVKIYYGILKVYTSKDAEGILSTEIKDEYRRFVVSRTSKSADSWILTSDDPVPNLDSYLWNSSGRIFYEKSAPFLPLESELATIYENYRKSHNDKLLESTVSILDIVRIYFQAQKDGDYETMYSLLGSSTKPTSLDEYIEKMKNNSSSTPLYKQAKQLYVKLHGNNVFVFMDTPNLNGKSESEHKLIFQLTMYPNNNWKILWTLEEKNNSMDVNEGSNVSVSYSNRIRSEVTAEHMYPLLPLEPKLQKIYEKYQKKPNDQLLKSLNPIDIVRIYFQADKDNDAKTRYTLFAKSSNPPPKEEYMKDTAEDNPSNMTHLYKEVKRMYTTTLSKVTTNFDGTPMEPNEFYVFMNRTETDARLINEHNTFSFRLCLENGVWKPSWLAIQ